MTNNDTNMTPRPDPYSPEERIVKFTPAEVNDLCEFLRHFEASPKALEFLNLFAMRSIYAVADLDLDSEPHDTSHKFGNQKNQAVVSARRDVHGDLHAENEQKTPRYLDLPIDERTVLLHVSKTQRMTTDGYVKVRGWDAVCDSLESKGLLERAQTKTPNTIFRTTDTARLILTVLESHE
jgi:hypothetical protein